MSLLLHVQLTAADLAEIEVLARKGVAAGERYNEAGTRALNL